MIVCELLFLVVKCLDHNSNKEIYEEDADHKDQKQRERNENELIVFDWRLVNIGCIHGEPHNGQPSFMALN